MTKVLVVCGGAGRGLLGQRDSLGFAAEMQLDVRQELLPVENDNYAWRLPVDAAVLTTRSVLDEMNQRWGKKTLTAQGRHARIMYLGYPGTVTNLDYGLGQSPAIGGAVIRSPGNEQMLRTATQQMIQRIGHYLGADNELDVWIVSSTCGGTGAGIRRWVATVIAQEIRALVQNCVIKLHFILYGSRTYTSIDAHRTSLNTFLGVAQDAAFVDTTFDMSNPPIRFLYYLELPDVGSGDRARREREKLVEVTARAMFLSELRPVLETVANNVPNKTVFVRVGFWGGELPPDQLYYETVKQLRYKLVQLTEPPDSRFLDGFKCNFEPSVELQEAMKQFGDSGFVLQALVRRWSLPRSGSLLGRHSREEFMAGCEKNIEQLLQFGQSLNMDRLSGIFRPEKAGVPQQPIGAASTPGALPSMSASTLTEAEREKLTRQLEISRPGQNITWTEKQELITDAHRVLAWCKKETENPDGRQSLEDQRLGLAQACSKAIHGYQNSQNKVQELANKLPVLLEATVKQRILQNLERRAHELLDDLEAPYLAVKAKAAEQEDLMLKAGVVSQAVNLVLAAELDRQVAVTNPRPWIELLERAWSSKKDEVFRRTVELGAVGLTMPGLAKVLGIDSEARDDIRKEVLSKAGGIMINKEKREGLWWQADTSLWNRGFQQFRFRIFPKLNDVDYKFLRGEDKTDERMPIDLITTSMGAIGLRVLAVDMVNIGRGDLSAAAESLLSPLKVHLRSEFEAWPADNRPAVERRTTGILHVARAGAGGESMDLTALERIGLTPDELAKLSYLYDLVKPAAIEAPVADEVQPTAAAPIA